MVLKKDTVLRALQKMRGVSKKRNFVQTIDFILNFKGLDFKKPESKIEVGVRLPFPVGRQAGGSKVLVFADDKDFAEQIKGKAARVVLSGEVSKLSKNDVEKLLQEFDVLMAQGPAMLAVGRHLGQILAPRARMPRLITNDVSTFVQELQATSGEAKVSNKKAKAQPLVHVSVGKESDDDEKVVQNILAVYNAVIAVLPTKEQNVLNALVKLTMGPPVYIGEKGEQNSGSDQK